MVNARTAKKQAAKRLSTDVVQHRPKTLAAQDDVA
jgi:hypothetical protein